MKGGSNYAYGMRGARLTCVIVLGCDHPDFVRELGGNRFEHGEAGCVDTVVVRQQYPRHFGFIGRHRGKLFSVGKGRKTENAPMCTMQIASCPSANQSGWQSLPSNEARTLSITLCRMSCHADRAVSDCYCRS
jgi:hypothetical protein